jgi:hypothetical protein
MTRYNHDIGVKIGATLHEHASLGLLLGDVATSDQLHRRAMTAVAVCRATAEADPELAPKCEKMAAQITKAWGLMSGFTATCGDAIEEAVRNIHDPCEHGAPIVGAPMTAH